MTYAKASTSQEIASLLRSGQPELVIEAPRQSGKTYELLKFAEEKNPNGQFAIVCAGPGIQKALIRRHWLLFNRIDQSDIVAQKLLGKPLGAVDVTPPLMVTPSTLYLLNGSRKPIYVDELGIMSNEDLMPRLIATGRFVAAVTS